MKPRRPRFALDRFIGLYLWLTFIIIFGAWEPHRFLTASTMHSIASEQAVTAMLGIAVVIPLAAGVYDLSVGATMNLATVIAVWLQSTKGIPMIPAIVLAIAASCAIGALNGIVVVKLKVNSFIATLGMATIVSAVQTIIVGATQPYPPPSTLWPKITATHVAGFQVIVVYLIVIASVMWWLLGRTATGRYMYAMGQQRGRPACRGPGRENRLR